MAEIVIAFDFECAGGVPSKHGFTQLGASAHVLATGEKLGGFNEYASMQGYVWEERCVEEFWKKQPERYAETLAATAAATNSCHAVVRLFVEWARGISKGRKCSMLSDKMIYDGGVLKYFADVDVIYLLGAWTVYYDIGSLYYGMGAKHADKRVRCATDDSSAKQAALEAVGKEAFPASEVAHDHHPEHDAEAMARKWVFIQQSLGE